VKVSRRARPQM